MSPSVATLAELLWLMNEELLLGSERVDWGHDATLNLSNLAVDAETRLRRGVVYARRTAEIRSVAARVRA